MISGILQPIHPKRNKHHLPTGTIRALCYNRDMPTKVVFMGSPDFSLATLRALARHYEVVGVVTQPDRAAGRGRELKPPPVKVLAQELGLQIGRASCRERV